MCADALVLLRDCPHGSAGYGFAGCDAGGDFGVEICESTQIVRISDVRHHSSCRYDSADALHCMHCRYCECWPVRREIERGTVYH